MPRVVSFVFLVLCGQWSTFAELQPAKIFSDHMVLQREAAVPLWGRANAEASVTVAFAEQSVATKADGKGRWKVELAPMKASAKGQIQIAHQKFANKEFEDVAYFEPFYLKEFIAGKPKVN